MIPWAFPMSKRPDARAPCYGHFMVRNCKAFREATSVLEETAPLDYMVAISNALIFWPAASDLFGMDSCPMFLQHEVFSDTPAKHPADNHTFTRTPKVGPMARAPGASEAHFADAQGFRMCGDMGTLETPLVGSSYGVWELQERQVAIVRPRKWHMTARSGPQARCDATNYIEEGDETPPAI